MLTSRRGSQRKKNNLQFYPLFHPWHGGGLFVTTKKSQFLLPRNKHKSRGLEDIMCKASKFILSSRHNQSPLMNHGRNKDLIRKFVLKRGLN